MPIGPVWGYSVQLVSMFGSTANWSAGLWVVVRCEVNMHEGKGRVRARKEDYFAGHNSAEQSLISSEEKMDRLMS